MSLHKFHKINCTKSAAVTPFRPKKATPDAHGQRWAIGAISNSSSVGTDNLRLCLMSSRTARGSEDLRLCLMSSSTARGSEDGRAAACSSGATIVGSMKVPGGKELDQLLCVFVRIRGLPGCCSLGRED